MQKAETVLEVLRERGRRGLPCNELYRQMFNPSLYLLAYGKIYANQGAMTPGASAETADGMSEDKIHEITGAMRAERYRFSPARRTYIPKKNGKMRPLGMPTWSDKLVGEVVRLLLEAYYEPTFSDHSHGFRPGRGCHTALTDVAVGWTGTTWFIEGDIADCFGSLDHEVMVRILSEKIRDNRFLRLIRNMLKAGYLEDWKYYDTLSGCPQGGVVSPVLSNIYLSKLDEFAETVLIPQYTRGGRRKVNPEYGKAHHRLTRARREGDRAKAREYQRQAHSLPFGDPDDPGYRRLRYSRYADDHLLGFTGPKAEAEDIKDELARFLRDELALELSPEKTLVTHARTRAARYLGYEITVQHADRKITRGRRSANGRIALRVPLDVILGQAIPLPAPRQTRVPDGPAEPGRLRHRPGIRGRVPGHRRLLPARQRRLAARRAALGSRDVHAQDPGGQAQVLGVQDRGPLQGQGRDTARAAHVLRGQDPARRQAGPGSPVRRDPPGEEEKRGTARHRIPAGLLPAERAGPPAPEAAVRTMRGSGRGPGRTRSANSPASGNPDRDSPPGR